VSPKTKVVHISGDFSGQGKEGCKCWAEFEKLQKELKEVKNAMNQGKPKIFINYGIYSRIS
jgi:hypothetical protein